MRRIMAIGVAAAVIGGGATIGSAWAGGSNSKPGSSASATAQATRIADSLASESVRASYHLPGGTIVSADVCVRGQCVHRQFAPAPTCAPAAATCIGTSLVARRMGKAVTISVELV